MTAAEVAEKLGGKAPSSAARLQRVAFRTDRVSEFVGQRELTAQLGHSVEYWPLVIAKELADNSIDSCEESEIAPEVTISVSTASGEIIVADNGPGFPAETIGDVVDFNSRTSARESYVSPSRGQQGNALKCILAMAFALDGTRGVTVDRVARGSARDHLRNGSGTAITKDTAENCIVRCKKRDAHHSALAGKCMRCARRGEVRIFTNGPCLRYL